MAVASPPPMAQDASFALWDAWTASRGAETRQALFHAYWPFARRIADRSGRAHGGAAADMDDVRQWAAAGLLEAIDRFDPGRGVPFEAYASRRISGCVADGLASSTEVRRQVSTRARIRQERVRSLAVPRPDTAQDAIGRLADLAADLALGFMLEDAGLYAAPDKPSPAPNAYETLAWSETLNRLGAEMERLTPQERQVLVLHYLEGLDFSSIATACGLSKGRISQIHKAALTRLRRRLLEPTALPKVKP